jgi:ketosteroid isomerase-like protein
MSGTPQEVFGHHVQALSIRDFDAVAADYAEDALVLTPTGEYRGRTAIRDMIQEFMGALPDPTFEAKLTAFADQALLLHWTADSRLHTVGDGVDTFIFGDGKIQVHTISCTLTPKT